MTIGIGCDNPMALASIKKGETIVDLGSVARFDCFLAAEQTGENGKVIGVDFTPAMVAQAKKNAEKVACNNVVFKSGEIENLPIESSSIDLIISNGVINLPNQKEQVFREAFRVIKPNGRMMISDIESNPKSPFLPKSSLSEGTRYYVAQRITRICKKLR